MNLTVNNINFQAKVNQNIVRKTGKVLSETSASAIGREDVIAAQEAKAKKIRKVIEKSIRKDRTIRIKEIARKTRIPENQVITIIYRNSFPEIKELFDKVKDSARLKKPVTDEDRSLAGRALYDASRYKVTSAEEIIEPEEDYLENITGLIHRAKVSRVWTAEAADKFAELFKTAPAFADMLLTVKNQNGKYRGVFTADLMELLFETYDINPDLTESLLSETDDEGMFRHTIKGINRIVVVSSEFPNLLDIAKEDVQTIYALYMVSDKNGERRFWGDEIAEIYGYIKKYPKITKTLINDFEHIEKYAGEEENAEEKPKTNTIKTSSINGIRPSQVFDSDRFKHVPKFTGEEIIYIMRHYESDPKLVEYLTENRAPGTRRKYSSGLIMEVLKSKEAYTQENKKWVWMDPFNPQSPVFTNKKELKRQAEGKPRL